MKSYRTRRLRVVNTVATLAAAAAATFTTLVPGDAGAEKIVIDDDTTLTIAALLQPQAAVAEEAAPDGSAGTDFFLRRARLIVGGQLTKKVSFFVDTEQANLGKDGNWETSIFLQDAFLSLEPVTGLFIDAGMMLIPFTRHDLQSAASLNGIDYHARLILFPAGGNRIWRDAGLQVRADLAANRVHLRGGIFNGVEGLAASDTMPAARNESDLPRLAGHARWNVLGSEKGFFFPGIAFADAPLVSVGMGVDWQADAVMTEGMATDHLGLAVDVFAEIPTLADQEVIFQASGFRYDDGDLAPTTGMGFFAEAGYRIGRFEPIVAIDVFEADAPLGVGDFRGLHAGGAVFLDRHRTNVKLDVALIRQGDGDDVVSGALQAQLFF